MRIQFFLFTICILSIQVSHAQTTVFKKIAQRSDAYAASAWKSIDSFRWDYNSNAFLTYQIRLKTDPSANWQNDFQYFWTLNANDSAISQVRQSWNGSTWTNVNRYTYDYNANNDLTEIFYETWNGSNWAYAGRYTYAGHNAKHKPTSLLLRNYVSGTWVNYFQEYYDYYPNDSSIESTEKYQWNTTTASWDKYERKFYTYITDSIGTITTSIPHQGSWLEYSKELNSYAGTPLLKTSYFYKRWDTTLTPDDWVDERKTAFTYTTFGAIATILKDENTPFGWQNDSRTTFVYNANNLLSESDYETYSGGWNKVSRFTRSYTGNNLTEEVQYVGLGSAWEEKDKFTFLYDANNLNTYRQKDTFNGASFFLNKRDFYYYNSFIVGTENVDEVFDQGLVYPNPTTDILFLKMNAKQGHEVSIQIFDAIGNRRKVITQPIFQGENNISFDIHSLEKGNYILRIINAAEKQQKVYRFEKK